MRDPRFSWSYPWQSESALGLRIVRVLSAGFFVPDRRMWRRRDALDAPAPRFRANARANLSHRL